MKQNCHYIAIKIGCNFFYYEFFLFLRWQVIYFSNVLKIIRNNRRSNTSSSKLNDQFIYVLLGEFTSERHPKRLLLALDLDDGSVIVKNIKYCRYIR